MATVAPARSVALAILSRARRRGAYARELLRSAPEMTRLSLKGRGLTSRLVLGTMATSGMLDSILDGYLKKPRSLEPRVRDALRISTFEALYLSTAAQVVVSQGVELVRSVAPRASGLANAVLRKVLAEGRPLVAEARSRVAAAAAMGASDVSAADLAFTAGMPRWLAEAVLSSLGPVRAASAAVSQLEPAPMWVAVNSAVCDDERAKRRLKEVGAGPVPIVLPGSFLLEHPAALSGSGLVGSVDVVVSDLGSQMVSRIGAPLPGTALLEVGQGRATKTILLENAAMSLGGAASIVAVDLSESKVCIARERVGHGWEADVVSLAYDARALDATDLPAELDRTFDTVFCDVPCSGTGTMRRHPEIPWSLKEANLDPANPDGLPALQLQILTAASRRCAVGGTVVYATCSILEEENAGVVRRFLESDAGHGFELVPALEAPGVQGAPEPFQELVAERIGPSGVFSSSPVPDGPDGHFAARLVRRG